MPTERAAPDGGRRTTVFLSYARVDRARAGKLAAALADAGLEVWWDALIEGGAAFAHSIRTALDTADVVIVAWSKTSINSDWVRDEAAVGRDRKRLVPLSLDGSEPPLGFRQYHVIDISRSRGKPGPEEITAILRAVAASAGAPAIAIEPRKAPVSRRTAMWVGSGLAAVLAGGVGGILAWRGGLFGGETAPDSIVVLPFKNLGGDPAQAYLSEGLTEEVRAALARNNALKVLAGTSSNIAQSEAGDATAIAQKLGVAYLLEGSVQRSNDMVRISTNLTDGDTGFSRWSNTVDRNLTDIFAVQAEIARTVADALSVRMATDQRAPGGTTSVPAYEAYLKGRSLFNAARDEESDRQALADYELAIATDPNFALAHAGRSRSLAAIASEYAKADALPALYQAAILAARRAVALAPDLAEAHLALGYALFTGRLDVAGARPAYDRAYELGRGDADIILLFALYCSRSGRPENAQIAVERALALDPLNPRTFRAAGSIAYAARRYRPGIAVLKQALALNPEISNAHGLIGNCLYFLGQTREARAAWVAEPHDLFRLPGLAIADHRLGDIAAARRSMAQLVTELGDSALYQQAEVLAQWGEIDAALEALERARSVGDSGLIYLTTDPMLDPLRRRPEFVKLLDELNLG